VPVLEPDPGSSSGWAAPATVQAVPAALRDEAVRLVGLAGRLDQAAADVRSALEAVPAAVPSTPVPGSTLRLVDASDRLLAAGSTALRRAAEAMAWGSDAYEAADARAAGGDGVGP
jgi:hypothetical protein